MKNETGAPIISAIRSCGTTLVRREGSARHRDERSARTIAQALHGKACETALGSARFGLGHS
jgi:hypothetical protein